MTNFKNGISAFRIIAIAIAIAIAILFTTILIKTTNASTLTSNVHFEGVVLNSTCAVSTKLDATTPKIYMMKAIDNEFRTLGSWSRETLPFSIQLDDCDLNILNETSITFSGEKDIIYPELFKAGSGPDAADGIGIAIFDSKKKMLYPNAKIRTYLTEESVQKNLHYIARYRFTKLSVKKGDASAHVWVSVYYE